MISKKLILPLIFIFVTATAVLPSISTAASQPMGASVTSTSPLNPNVTIAIPVDAHNVSVLPDVSVIIYGFGNFNVTLDNKTIEQGVSTTSMYVNFTLSANVSHNITILLNGAIYSQMTDLHVVSVATFTNVQLVFISSTFPGQSQDLYAHPQSTKNESVQQMYPYFNITMVSSYPQHYAVYVNGNEIQSGTANGIVNVLYHDNGSVATVTVGLGVTVYKFPSLAISQVPLRVKYQPPTPPALYTQEFLDIFTVKVDAGVILAIVGVALVIAPVTATKKNRTTM